jgi:methylthioribulose 1-phosphate dehydratase / enolase-phosphatase E1
LGEHGHEHDAKTSSSSNLPTTTAAVSPSELTVEDVEQQAYAVRSLIAQLCETFYKAGWATGTGGGCSIRVLHPITQQWRVFVAPSGIQKEDMIGDDIFELNMAREVIVPPKTIGLRQSACTPLWYVVYQHRPTATCVIHTHSMTAVQATLLDPTEQSTFLRITHLEMLKGVGNHAYDDYLDIPIIDNRPTEDLLADQLEHALLKYPKCNAVLVRRHGLYCWGDTWEQAKTQCESFDYLFDCVIRMKLLGIDYTLPPKSGTYRPEEPKSGSDGFHGHTAVDNISDCLSCPVPLLPRDRQYQVLLLDIEGCTTSISFVKDVLFPYSRDHMESYCSDIKKNDPSAYEQLKRNLLREIIVTGNDDNMTRIAELDTCSDMALYLIDHDMKVAPLKEIQGQIWKRGYESCELQGHVYADVLPTLQWLHQQNIKVCIYSSGSVQAQKLLFGSTKYGFLQSYFHSHFDIVTSGSKKKSSSYSNIAATLQVPITDICFVSDSIDELKAAQHAGMVGTVLSIRPGNAPLSPDERNLFPSVHSLLQLCGAE